MNLRAMTWTAALSGVGAALLWQFRDRITDGMIDAVIHATLTALIWGAITIAGWLIGGARTEAYKWDEVRPDDPHDPDDRDETIPPTWKRFEARQLIGRAARKYGGTATTALLLILVWPVTIRNGDLVAIVQQLGIILVWGVGIGGYFLPVAYKLGLGIIIPMLMVRMGYKLVQTARGAEEYRPADQQSEPGTKTTFGGGDGA